MIMLHSHLNDMKMLGTKHFIPKEFEFGKALSQPNQSIGTGFPRHFWRETYLNIKLHS